MSKPACQILVSLDDCAYILSLLSEDVSQEGEGEEGDDVLESDGHVLRCWAYADLRLGKRLLEDQELVNYYTAVLERRTQLCD